MKTFFSLFSGFDLAGVGAAQAGYDVIGGIEREDRIAQVARDNGHPIMTRDILDAKPSRFDLPDLLHASPPCPNFSVAKQNRGETPNDIALAEKVCEFLRAWKPRAFTLENVVAYRKSESFAKIMQTLDELGYMTDAQNINSADYGVSQTRVRLWVRAVRGGLVPPLPPKQKWNGWYDAIEDLIPTLPDSEFADWQIPKLPREIRTFMMQVQGEGGDGVLFADEPMQTVTANHGASKYRAFVMAGGDMWTPPIYGENPIFTITASKANHPTRALLETGRVVSMTPRALARFQAIPNSFRLPDKKTLACTGVGNGVPCELARVLYEGLLK